MPTAAPSLTEEIQQLRADLAAAQLQRLSAADRHVIALQKQLVDKEHELFQQQESEAAAAAEQQHASQLLALVQMEKAISDAKAEVSTLRTMLSELPQRLSRAQWELSQLLRQHAQLKKEIEL